MLEAREVVSEDLVLGFVEWDIHQNVIQKVGKDSGGGEIVSSVKKKPGCFWGEIVLEYQRFCGLGIGGMCGGVQEAPCNDEGDASRSDGWAGLGHHIPRPKMAATQRRTTKMVRSDPPPSFLAGGPGAFSPGGVVNPTFAKYGLTKGSALDNPAQATAT
jgi:hypothetical protein